MKTINKAQIFASQHENRSCFLFLTATACNDLHRTTRGSSESRGAKSRNGPAARHPHTRLSLQQTLQGELGTVSPPRATRNLPAGKRNEDTPWDLTYPSHLPQLKEGGAEAEATLTFSGAG